MTIETLEKYANYAAIPLAEVRQILRISERTLYRKLRAKQLPCVKLGNSWFFDPTALHQLAASIKPRENYLSKYK